MPDDVAEAKRPGRPRKAEAAPAPTVVQTPEEASRQEWHAFQARAASYADEHMDDRCPDCGARPGYNPITGIQVRSVRGKEVIDGHRDSCPRNTASKKK